ncbi:MAG: nickel pincer cofactor biosynthesis protein LarB [Candidatus Verstraetearchaeota archaeon]|nr:nickel pincer cofactor biosynthesis protein LarB [Candidatus Verstraetearchaeota archaeon]
MLRRILSEYKSGNLSLDDAEKMIRLLALKEIESACLDISREARKGIPEIVLAEGKDTQSLIQIAAAFLEESGWVLITRISGEKMESLKAAIDPSFQIKYSARGRVASISKPPGPAREMLGRVALFTAGTSDLGVAEEARFILEEMGCSTHLYRDVGIAGLHRVFPALKDSIEMDVDAIIVFAGMEGALASVVSSLAPIPVIGVPTSSGYGYGGKGVAALMAMLQSCAPGLLVVNIDNGVGAAVAAATISRLRWQGSCLRKSRFAGETCQHEGE